MHVNAVEALSTDQQKSLTDLQSTLKAMLNILNHDMQVAQTVKNKTRIGQVLRLMQPIDRLLANIRRQQWIELCGNLHTAAYTSPRFKKILLGRYLYLEEVNILKVRLWNFEVAFTDVLNKAEATAAAR